MCLAGYYHDPMTELLTMCTLLVGIYVGSAAVENNIKVSDIK